MRAIDGDALEKYLSDAEIEAIKQRRYVFASALNTICGNVRNFPTIEPERKKGKWEITNLGAVGVFDSCSECKRVVKHKAPFYNFCPNCGCDMRGEQE